MKNTKMISDRNLNRMAFLASSIWSDPKLAIIFIDRCLAVNTTNDVNNNDTVLYGEFLIGIKNIFYRYNYNIELVLAACMNSADIFINRFGKLMKYHPEKRL